MSKERDRRQVIGGRAGSVEYADLCTEVSQALDPGCFFVRAGLAVVCRHSPHQTVAWELLGGHLLDATQTRQSRIFAAWDVRLSGPGQAAEGDPLLSVYWDKEDEVLFVVRHLLVHGFEAYEAEPNVICSRPAQKWTRELVGSLRPQDAPLSGEFATQLRRLVWMALRGTSRLPVTSWESPLPAYALGHCGYLPRGQVAKTCRTPVEFLFCALEETTDVQEHAAALDFVLRAASHDEIPHVAALLSEHCLDTRRAAESAQGLFQALFNQLALTPYAQLGENLVALLRQLAEDKYLGPAVIIDIVSYYLRHLVRHVTAFDLRTFHNRGADYPDLLLLDGLLKLYLTFIAEHPGEFQAPPSRGTSSRRQRIRRRALRQAWYVRKHYEGLPVPETPTSSGDRLRALPAEFPRAEEEEILEPHKRPRRLFTGDPLEISAIGFAKEVLTQGLADLSDEVELRELGMALYLDRPLGIAKQPGEVDRTPLLSYEAFSRTVPGRRLDELHHWGLLNGSRYAELRENLQQLKITGQPPPSGWPPRPGSPCLEDANVVAPDFLFLRTTRGSLNEFLAAFDLDGLRAQSGETYDWLLHGRDVLLTRRTSRRFAADVPFLAAIDGAGVTRAELDFADPVGSSITYFESRGRELPARGLRVLRLTNPAGHREDTSKSELLLHSMH